EVSTPARGFAYSQNIAPLFKSLTDIIQMMCRESLVTGCFFVVAQKHPRPRLVLLVATRNHSGFQVSRAGKVTCLLPGTSRRLDVPGERLELS
ncbi:MAG: hypothetical protein AAB447_00010, partial [Patescibacteria group bacterium]